MVLQKHSFLKFILLQLIYNVKFCCTASDSVIHICTFFFIFLYIMAYPRILNTVSCTIQLILHSQSFSPSPTLLGNHRSVLQKPLMFPLQDKKLEFCPKMQSWCSIREGMFKHWICKYTNTSWPKCRGESKGKTPYEAWEFSATGFSTAVTQKQTKKKATLECKSNLLTLLCKKISKFPRTEEASLWPRSPEKGFFPPLPSSMAHRHLLCVGLVAGWKTPGSLSVNKTHVDGLPWHQKPMGFCMNSFSPRRCFDLKMLKQLKRKREKGFKIGIAETLQHLHSHHSSSCRKPREQEMWETASCPDRESGTSSDLLGGPWNRYAGRTETE